MLQFYHFKSQILTCSEIIIARKKIKNKKNPYKTIEKQLGKINTKLGNNVQ